MINVGQLEEDFKDPPDITYPIYENDDLSDDDDDDDDDLDDDDDFDEEDEDEDEDE